MDYLIMETRFWAVACGDVQAAMLNDLIGCSIGKG